MKKSKKLIIIGDSSFAEVAYEYFTHDSIYQVIAFCIEQKFIYRSHLFDLPIVPFEDVEAHYPPSEYEFFVAIPYTKLNRLRTRLYTKAKEKGYQPASYISPRAFIWPNVTIGEHCFIFEDNVIQAFAHIGCNVILWSGNHIGHHTTIKDNCFISSHVVISGHCEIGKNSFIGVNCTLADRVTLGDDSLLGAGAVILKSAEEKKLYKTQATLGEDLNLTRFLNK